ncbi:MAG: sugar phosphate isomerase/epimerase family protein [Planctomycetota bacterium]
MPDRRTFLQIAGVAAVAPPYVVPHGRQEPPRAPSTQPTTAPDDSPHEDTPLFEISLAQWSLHRTLFAGELDALDFAKSAAEDFDIHAIEYVNSFFKDKAKDRSYIDQLKRNAEAHDVKSLIIMVDGEGNLGAPDERERMTAVENHYQWVEAAKQLGCHSIRVNARSEGTYDEQRDRAADGLRRLCEFADDHDIDVIVENHGGLSSNGAWLAAVMKQVEHPRCGTLPDFGNFHIGDGEWYDRYTGVRELMPYAKAVSAKSNDFNDDGEETNTDYVRMMTIVLKAGYRGFVGVEYEGQTLPEAEGIRRTKVLLERVREQLTPKFQ